MKKLNFAIQINAPKAQVWQTLWDDKSYRQWTSVFQEGSYAESDWQEGSKIFFMDGKGNGMTSRIARKIPHEFMSFEHLGVVKNGNEDFESAKTEGWSGSLENYTLIENGNTTDLKVTLDADDNFENYFSEKFPMALDKVKALAEGTEKTVLTVDALINAPEEKVWELWTMPEHVMKWNNASDDWHTPAATNDLRKGGRFSYTMAAKDGSFSFDFGGVYDTVKKNQTIAYTMDDGRKAEVTFTKKGETTKVTEVFEAENENPIELQKGGWQAILNNFKKYAEAQTQGNKNKIFPCLWFDGQAKAAAQFYCSVFPNSKITDDTPMVVNFELYGHKFMGLNGGPHFKPNPSISFSVMLETEAEADATWQKLSDGGSVLMPYDKYAWSEKYGWLQDRFGISWQISMGKISETEQQIFPSLIFVGNQNGKAEEAMNFYTNLFKNSAIKGIARYEAGEGDKEGNIKHAQFTLNNQDFTAMESSGEHPFVFNEAISLVVDCENQEEVDYYWEKLTEDGEGSMCAWLKDRFGVSWQIVPKLLSKLLNDPDREKANRAMQAMMKMRKIDTKALQTAFNGA